LKRDRQRQVIILTFADLLREYMEEKTLDEVIEHCQRQGVKLERTYLSKIRTGARPAPEDENVVRALARACGRDPEPLVLLAAIERHPRKAFLMMMQRELDTLGVTLEISQIQAAQLQRIAEIAKSDGSMDQVKAVLAQDSEKMLELMSRRQQLIDRDSEFMRLFGSTEIGVVSEHIFNSLDDKPQPMADLSEDALIEALAEAAAVPADGLRDLVKALKTVTTGIRRKLEKELKGGVEAEASISQQDSPVS